MDCGTTICARRRNMPSIPGFIIDAHEETGFPPVRSTARCRTYTEMLFAIIRLPATSFTRYQL
jgi:hypothetical protein